MAKLIFLGTANSLSDEDHENTHMFLAGRLHSVLIDCVNSSLLRLKKAGVSADSVTDLIATHFHPDHISGLPQFLMDMWLMGRRNPLNIYGFEHTLERVRVMMELYDWRSWPDFFRVSLITIPTNELALVMEDEEFRILASPMKHFIPTLGLRIEMKDTGKVAAYSCDTEPCPQVTRLATEADFLIHEASGALKGHSSAEQAGTVAREARARALYLIHYPVGECATGDIVAEARKVFPGPVTQAEDYMSLQL